MNAKGFCTLLIILLVSLGVGALALSCGGRLPPPKLLPGPGPQPTYDLTKLNAIPVTTNPVVDGKTTDSVWANAPELVVGLGDGMETMSCATCHAHDSATKVHLKAVYTPSRITVLASWPDSTASFTRGGSWSFANGSWEKPNAGQSEDRVSFFFPIGTIGGDDFNTGGCMTKCHTTDKHPEEEGNEDEAYLTSGTADMWHMKAARSLGVTSASGSGLTVNATHEVTAGTLTMVGWMDDKWIGPWSADNAPDGGRYGDEGSSTYSHNRIGDKSRPKYMETNPTDFTDAMILTQAEIDAGEVVGDADAGVSDADAATYWPNYEALNAVVPERILRPASGSRGDLIQGATWSNGTWTVEISRPLNTGNSDDIQFQPGHEYTFGVATMDNTGGEGHKTSDKHTLLMFQ